VGALSRGARQRTVYRVGRACSLHGGLCRLVSCGHNPAKSGLLILMLLTSKLFVCNDPGRHRLGHTCTSLNKPRDARVREIRDRARVNYALVWIRIVEVERRVEDVRVVMRMSVFGYVYQTSRRLPDRRFVPRADLT
jgi:hypothetical protein